MSEPTGGCPFQPLPDYPIRRDPAQPFALPPLVTHLRQERPISKVRLWDGNEAWLLTRMEDVRAMLGDDRFSNAATHERYPTWSAAVKAQKTTSASFLRKDKPEHTAERRLWQAFFTPAHINALKVDIQRLVDQAIDTMIASGQPADLCATLAPAVPTGVISRLLGVPDADLPFIQWVGVTRTSITSSREEVQQALNELHAYWLRAIDARAVTPGDDLVSQLIVSEVRTGRISRENLASMCILVVLAGFGTTADMIGLGTLMLLQHPDTLARLRADPAHLPAVLDEILRYTSIAQHGLARVALEDVRIGNVTIRQGEGVIAHLASANRDESMFDHPDEFDDQRNTRFHVAFGSGPHVCIGAPLARAELQIVFETLFRRLPGLRVAARPDAIAYRLDSLFLGVERLLVEW